jgi:hypothetical protein
MFHSENSHVSYHPISLFIFTFHHSFHIESLLFFSTFAVLFSQLTLRLLVLDTLNNPHSVLSSTNIVEYVLTTVVYPEFFSVGGGGGVKENGDLGAVAP